MGMRVTLGPRYSDAKPDIVQRDLLQLHCNLLLALQGHMSFENAPVTKGMFYSNYLDRNSCRMFRAHGGLWSNLITCGFVRCKALLSSTSESKLSPVSHFYPDLVYSLFRTCHGITK